MISFNYSWHENHWLNRLTINALTIPRKTETNLNWQLNWRNKSRLLINWSHLLCYRTFFGRSIAFNTYLIFIFQKQRTLTGNNKKIHMKPVIKLFSSRIPNVVWKKWAPHENENLLCSNAFKMTPAISINRMCPHSFYFHFTFDGNSSRWIKIFY